MGSWYQPRPGFPNRGQDANQQEDRRRKVEKVDIAIIGAGVVGLALAREISSHSRCSIAVLEKNRSFGLETSSRNSEVIHSGIYYPSSMLKTRLCVEGRALLYAFCEKYNIIHHCTGKIITSHMSDDPQLDRLRKQAEANGITVRTLGKYEIKTMEPAILAESSLLVPCTGIVDSHGLMKALNYQGRENQVIFLFSSPVESLVYDGDGYIIETPVENIKAQVLINASGLSASTMAAMLGLDLDACGYRMFPCKGEYYKIHRRFPVNHLIYPLPGPISLGIHLTIDSGGGLRLGPNAFYVNDLDYSVSEDHQSEFFEAACKYLPHLQPQDLSPDFSGIRPKLQGPGDPKARDFVIQEESDRGFPGLINLIGIESPGLTSCLAIARHVVQILN
ncbi:MAG TPA: NAD(P)/FAD-dependent oxidoreductase [Syntrophomonadaceae bacterium]|nr:NAD(P)/FAD-dependent oxidoreductase [Syntrophomonadaceae bacterium]